MSELSEASLFIPPPGFHPGITGRGTLQHPQILIWIGHFDTCNLTNVQQPSTCFFDHWNIFFINKFSHSPDKFLKEINKKTTYKTFTKICYFLYTPCFMLIANLCKQPNIICKNILFYIRYYIWDLLVLYSKVFKLFKKQQRDKQTKTCFVVREHCCVISTYSYF